MSHYQLFALFLHPNYSLSSIQASQDRIKHQKGKRVDRNKHGTTKKQKTKKRVRDQPKKTLVQKCRKNAKVRYEGRRRQRRKRRIKRLRQKVKQKANVRQTERGQTNWENNPIRKRNQEAFHSPYFRFSWTLLTTVFMIIILRIPRMCHSAVGGPVSEGVLPHQSKCYSPPEMMSWSRVSEVLPLDLRTHLEINVPMFQKSFWSTAQIHHDPFAWTFYGINQSMKQCMKMFCKHKRLSLHNV